jgi:hypothetical protein
VAFEVEPRACEIEGVLDILLEVGKVSARLD